MKEEKGSIPMDVFAQAYLEPLPNTISSLLHLAPAFAVSLAPGQPTSHLNSVDASLVLLSPTAGASTDGRALFESPGAAAVRERGIRRIECGGEGAGGDEKKGDATKAWQSLAAHTRA